MSDLRWLETIRAYLGEARMVGAGNNPAIMELWTAAKLDAYDGDDTPFCAATINGCFAMNGIHGSGSAAARSFANWGERCGCVRGAVALIQPANAEAINHVCFVLEDQGTHVLVIGGNQGDAHAVTVTRYRKNSIVGYRWPTGEPGMTPTHPDDLRGESRLVDLGSKVKSTGAWGAGLTTMLGLASTATENLLPAAVSPSATGSKTAAATPPSAAAASSQSATTASPDAVAAMQEMTGALGQIKTLMGIINDLTAFIASHSQLLLVAALLLAWWVGEKMRKLRAETQDKIKQKTI